jgi:aspartyl/asparaginyl beta-hydroxylase (cupin superfamily)
MSFIENIGYNAFRIHLWYVFHWKYRLQAFRINLQCDPEIKKTKLIKKQAG